MKMSVILGKKQIVLASLVTILGIAVYLNYVFAGGSADLLALCYLLHFLEEE